MRAPLVVTGLLVLAGAWLGPLERLAPGAFSAHMAVHMTVVAVAAPLLAFGIAGSRLDPFRKFSALAAPVLISVVELVVVWAWHAPALHHAARHIALCFVVEQGMFLLAALLLWLSLFGGKAHVGGNRCGTGVVALLLTSMHMTLLGALLALAPRQLYAHAGAPIAGTASNALGDQELGGAIMIVAGGAAYLLGGLWLTARLLQGGIVRTEATS
jgi:putative membrane protein